MQAERIPINRSRTTTGRLLGALAAVLLGGCASPEIGRDFVAPGLDPAALEIAVLPFENLSGYPDAGRIVAELIATELYRRRTFAQLEGSEVRRRMRERGLSAEAIGEATHAARLARDLEVGAVLTGSVSEYGYQHGLHEEPKVGINLRLVRARDGAVLWAASHSAAGAGYLRRETLNAAAQRVVARMVEALERALGG